MPTQEELLYRTTVKMKYDIGDNVWFLSSRFKTPKYVEAEVIRAVITKPYGYDSYSIKYTVRYFCDYEDAWIDNDAWEEDLARHEIEKASCPNAIQVISPNNKRKE